MLRSGIWITPLLFGSLAAPTADRSRVAQTTPIETARLPVSAATRLLVVAPHPDDEVLSSAGLIQRVRRAGGAVHIVYLTDGDGYPEGVRVQDHVAVPTASDYRGYGKLRQRESRAALAALTLQPSSATYLGFPDAGLCSLLTKYWSDRAAAYRSPFTRRDRPPRADIVVPNAEYRGEDLTLELVRVIDAFQPTVILAPRREDQHPDHCAAAYFVGDAIRALQRVRRGFQPEILNYVIHYNAWPLDSRGGNMSPPEGLRGGVSGWIQLPLTPRERAIKRSSIEQYRSQERTMSAFLDGFVRPNEIFSRPAAPHGTLPLDRNPCCHQ